MVQAVEAKNVGSANLAQGLMQMLTGFWVTQALYVVAKLGVADYLADGPQPVSVLAAKAQASEDYLYRVMRALAGLGIFSETENRRFSLAPVSELLRSNHPDSMRPVVLLLGDVNYRAWGQLYQAVKTGGYPFELAFGKHAFDYFEQNPRSGEIFNEAMTALARHDQVKVAEYYDFGQFNCVVDVGGGHGMLLAAILKQYPSLSAILFDLPHVVSEAEPYLQQHGIAGRCRIAGGNFFESVVEGGDAYILSHTVHGFGDELTEKILLNVHRAMPTHGKLLLVEDVLKSEPDPATIKTKLMDLNMLVMTPGGRERTQEEFEHLFEKTGFRLTRIVPAAGTTAVIEADKQ